ncbi:hypothetical protein K493DRAFT_33459 [Basidiobolus meristosporus CBS 931.73]|uniref:Uncharacterized protein n=1 Tax=Basidiobolus meristosporus CBS 931.73 TaxID=1314790 RepID=A0A1Y1Z630_9FUNG|nr:hypothetical protein K493DRAFT_33459 [Basidiobolus meristosporus CBS 931.73]|eukprot:ORY05762.1 hypothetical protein K493DRAFT_33459 [Basidiobolus meristosporus CBS 931.73]
MLTFPSHLPLLVFKFIAYPLLFLITTAYIIFAVLSSACLGALVSFRLMYLVVEVCQFYLSKFIPARVKASCNAEGLSDRAKEGISPLSKFRVTHPLEK